MSVFKRLLCIGAMLALVACDAKDQCLDAGGSYDEASQVCRH